VRTDYPPDYAPGYHWSSDIAWEILDHFEPGAFSDTQRMLLAGMIASVLIKERGDRNTAIACLKEIINKRKLDAVAAASMRASAKDALKALETE
jgi:hypothetical protein